MIWDGAKVGRELGDIVSGELVRVAISTCVGSKAFSNFTQDHLISSDVDELYSTIFFNINGGYCGVASEVYVGFFSSGRCWDMDGFNVRWSFCLQ